MSARAAAALAAVLVIVTSCTGAPVATKHHQEPGPATPTQNGRQVEAERHAIADRILRARARAVREHDERAWLAPLDPADTALVQRERRLFANLSRPPLQVFTLRANTEWTWPEGFADPRYAATAYLPYVELHVRRGGRAVTDRLGPRRHRPGGRGVRVGPWHARRPRSSCRGPADLR